MEEARPAGFWMRAVAALVDFSVFFLVQVSFGYVAGRAVGPEVEDLTAFVPLVWIFTLVFAGAYTTVLHALVGGQTIGKMLVGVRVVDADGGPVPVGAALLRFTGYFVSLAVFGLGYAMVGLRRDKRALHDLIAGTRVEHVAAGRAPAPSVDPVGPARPG
jgi:uncharacterized RDD family membrane protein YckC